MIILSFDSTASTATASIARDAELLACVTLNLGSTHSTTLLPSVKFILESAKLGVDDVDLLAVSAGPGSYTGVRIGCATAKGLLFAHDIPCIGVSSLEVLARPHAAYNALICPMINARSDRYFSAMFTSVDGRLARISDDDVRTGDEIAKDIADRASENIPLILCGDGATLFAAAHPEITPSAVPETLMFPSAYYAGEIAREIWNSSDEEAKKSFTATALRPVYLRKPQAERELASGKLKIN